MPIPLEFSGERALPAWFDGGYDCRICMILRGEQETEYQARTGRRDVWVDGRLLWTAQRVQVGMMVICLPDHNYAHADHNKAEKHLYGEMLEARLPRSESEHIGVPGWLAENSGPDR